MDLGVAGVARPLRRRVGSGHRPAAAGLLAGGQPGAGRADRAPASTPCSSGAAPWSPPPRPAGSGWWRRWSPRTPCADARAPTRRTRGGATRAPRALRSRGRRRPGRPGPGGRPGADRRRTCSPGCASGAGRRRRRAGGTAGDAATPARATGAARSSWPRATRSGTSPPGGSGPPAIVAGDLRPQPRRDRPRPRGHRRPASG